MNSGNFAGKVAFVTGAASGIGQSVAVAFGREGAVVIGAGRNATAGAEIKRLVEAAGGTFQFVPMDLGQEARGRRTVRRVQRPDELGRLISTIEVSRAAAR